MKIFFILWLLVSRVIADDTIKVDVSSEQQKCIVNSDCVRSSLECSCDCGMPINTESLKKLLKLKEIKCKDYKGPYCKMECPGEVVCKDNQCILVTNQND